MECNKDEAVKAMQLSEKKMQNKDYTGAMKMAQKAQRLFPDLENISRLLTVCEVHCTAENKIGGSEMDWYKILQIQQFDRDDTISKHYKKLALLLHPDKNKFAGSDAAFKWIVEAKNVLLDKQKRTLYDIKYRTLVRPGAPKTTAHPAATPKTTAHPAATPKTTAHPAATPKTTAHPAATPKTTAHPAATPKTTAHPAATTKTTAHPAATTKTTAYPAATTKTTAHPAATINSQKNPQSQWGPNPYKFWTECYFCLTKFQYYRNLLNQILRCQKCQNVFEARELQGGINPESFRNIFSNHEKSQTNGGTEERHFTRFQNGEAAAKPAAKVGNSADLSRACDAEKKDIKHEVEVGKQGVDILKSRPLKSEDVGTSSNISIERAKINSELGEGLATGNRATADTEHAVKVKVELSAGLHHRRSPRNKHNLSSLLNEKDDDFVSPPLKRLRKSGLSGAADKMGNDVPVDGNKQNSREKVDFYVEVNLSNKKIKVEEFELKVKRATMSDNDRSNSNADVSPVANVTAASTSGPIELPDPQFHKFSLDADSLPSLVKAGQLWALFEERDSMPRWYAYIKKVLKRGHKLKINWLEPIPYDKGVNDWCEKELPVACGTFKLGKSDEIQNHLVFAHQMYYTKGRGSSPFWIYPRKGETWAIYQNWDIGWSSEPEKHTPFKYEFVEVLTDIVEGDGIVVCKLGKVRGFVSLFQQTEQQDILMFKVPPHELYRFSHRIHSFKMTGCEAHGVPPGCFELDPASLPASIFDSSDLGVSETDDRSKKTEADGSCCEKIGSR